MLEDVCWLCRRTEGMIKKYFEEKYPPKRKLDLDDTLAEIYFCMIDDHDKLISNKDVLGHKLSICFVCDSLVKVLAEENLADLIKDDRIKLKPMKIQTEETELEFKK